MTPVATTTLSERWRRPVGDPVGSGTGVRAGLQILPSERFDSFPARRMDGPLNRNAVLDARQPTSRY